MNLRDLLDPVDEATFFGEHWEKSHLHASRSDPRRFEGLLNLDDIDRLLAESMFRTDECKVARQGEVIASERYAAAPGMRVMERTAANLVDARKLLALFDDGATLVFSQLNHKCPALGRLKETLERQLLATVVTNVFLSNRRSQGFSAHYDSHDVFVLQLQGSKMWSVYGNPIELPLKSQAFGSAAVDKGPLARDITLHAGDMLYLPRGVFHEARTTDSVSLHLTLGVHPYLCSDYIDDLLTAVAHQSPALRRSMPRSWLLQDAASRAGFLRQVLSALLDRPDFDELATLVYAKAVARKIEPKLQVRRGQLGGIAGGGDIAARRSPPEEPPPRGIAASQRRDVARPALHEPV